MADWVDSLDDAEAPAWRAFLRGLPLDEVERLPPPRRGGLPFGNELAVLWRHAVGRSCHLRPSGLSGLYQRLASEPARLALRTLVAGLPLPREGADAWLGEGLAAAWLRAGWLEDDGAGNVRACMRLVCVEGVPVAVDPLATRFRNRVHIGSDSAKLVAFAARHAAAARGRVLDVGTGSGIVLLRQARDGRFDEACGIDINPRAVRVARFNAALNEVPAVIDEADVFEATGALGRFDRITWNTPFRFFPESLREDNVDGFGGNLGTELTLRFLGTLPRLLADDGQAFLLTAGPMMHDRSRPLDEAAAELAKRHGLDLELSVQGAFFDPQLAAFHREHGVEGFESVVLALAPGSGRVVRHEAPGATRALDAVRWGAHQLRLRRLPAPRTLPADAERQALRRPR